MKFVYWHSACGLCYEYGLQTWLAPSEEIRDLALDIQLICDEYGLETWVAPTEEICVLQPMCAE